MTEATLTALPLWSQRDEFLQRATESPLLVEAEPGAGKSTLIPLWALESAPRDQQIWLIQPRILATRAVARRLSQLNGEPLGHSVGYQVPFDRQLNRKNGAPTRLVVMTPGIFLQRLLKDPELKSVHAVILDEMHERSVDLDLAWVWLQECQILHEGLQVIVMTATPDPGLQAAIDNRLQAPGRQFPVTTRYLPYPERQSLPQQVTQSLQETQADHATVLVFLPGWRDIEQCRQAIEIGTANTSHRRPLYRLHSRVSEHEQQQALDPDTGPRIILATNLAETSLTVPDVTLVIDSGLVRNPAYTQKTGVTRLHTERISLASADQRRGRAGRVAAGHCIRLWAESEALPPAPRPEILRCDALPLTLKLAHWGTPQEQLAWLDTPSTQALLGAQNQLQMWKMLDQAGKITAQGRLVSELGTHPRVAALLINGVQSNRQLSSSLINLALALHFGVELETEQAWEAELLVTRQRERIWQQLARRWQRVLDVREHLSSLPIEPLLYALPDRIGHRQPSGRYHLTSGISVQPRTPLATEWACFPMIQPQGSGHSGVGIAVELTATLQKAISLPERHLVWHQGNKRQSGWQEQTQWRLGDRVISEELTPLPDQQLTTRLCAHLQTLPLQHYPWSARALSLLQRARLADNHGLIALPDLTDRCLLDSLTEWLLPFLHVRSAPDALPWLEGLRWYLGESTVHWLDEHLPTRYRLPSGQHRPVLYDGEPAPRIEARLQDFLGLNALYLANGQIPMTAVMLSPAQRPVAITADLMSFWVDVYPEVRKEMRGRYPKHHWPERPI